MVLPRDVGRIRTRRWKGSLGGKVLVTYKDDVMTSSSPAGPIATADNYVTSPHFLGAT